MLWFCFTYDDVMNPESFVNCDVLVGIVGLPVTYDQLTADRYGTSLSNSLSFVGRTTGLVSTTIG